MKQVTIFALFFITVQINAVELGHNYKIRNLTKEEELTKIDAEIRSIAKKSKKLREAPGINSINELCLLAKTMLLLHQQKEALEKRSLYN